MSMPKPTDGFRSSFNILYLWSILMSRFCFVLLCRRSSVMARVSVCDAASQEELQIRDCSVVAMIYCSINTDAKPAAAKSPSVIM